MEKEARGSLLSIASGDDGAFRKYPCPVTAVLKLTSRFALLRIEGEKGRCTDRGACTKACPMDVNIPEYIENRERVLSTECISCQTGTIACPEGILSHSFKVDLGEGDTQEKGTRSIRKARKVKQAVVKQR